MIRNHVRWVYWGIKYEDYKNDWYKLKLENLRGSWLTEQLWLIPTFLIKLLPRVQEILAAKLECFEIHEREYEYSRKRFWSSTCSTKSRWKFTIIQEIRAAPSGIADDVEDSEKWRNWEKWERRTIAINTFTLLFSKSKEKKSRRQISLMSMTDHALGIWTCTQLARTIPSYASA